MISPPVTPTYVSSLLPTRLEEFDFEPHFPIMIISTISEKEKAATAQHRLLALDVDRSVVHDEDPTDEKRQHSEIIQKLEEWLDDVGI